MMKQVTYLSTLLVVAISFSCNKREGSSPTDSVQPPTVRNIIDTFRGNMEVHHFYADIPVPLYNYGSFDTNYKSECYVEHLSKDSLKVTCAFWDMTDSGKMILINRPDIVDLRDTSFHLPGTLIDRQPYFVFSADSVAKHWSYHHSCGEEAFTLIFKGGKVN